MKIIVDTREQRPLWTVSKHVERRKLIVGDYTTEALENKMHVERKSPMDLYGSIVQDHERFRKMLIKALDKNIEVVIFVECTREVFVTKTFEGGHLLRAKGEVIGKIMNTIEERYKSKVVWCNDRNHMKTFMRQYFKERETNGTRL